MIQPKPSNDKTKNEIESFVLGARSSFWRNGLELQLMDAAILPCKVFASDLTYFGPIQQTFMALLN